MWRARKPASVWPGSNVHPGGLSLTGGLLSASVNDLAVGGQRDVDVTARGVGVRANLVGCPDQLDRLGGVVDRGEPDVECDSDLEAPLLGREQRYLGVDRDIGGVLLCTTGHDSEGTLEAGCVSDRKELLRIRTVTLATHLLG